MLMRPAPWRERTKGGQKISMTDRGRILVVDDERHQRDILKMILEGEGYETAVAGNARQALEEARDGLFDVILTDLKMPDKNGIALLTELVKTQPGVCVVLMTAHGSIDSAVDAMRKGAFDYMTKPLEKDELLLVVRRAVGRSPPGAGDPLPHQPLPRPLRLQKN